MTDTNPYIVRETAGNAYTIRRFVTGRPLSADEMRPDSHGIYPVSPLGFMADAAGRPLEVAPATVAFVPDKVYDGNGDEVGYDELVARSYRISGRYSLYSGTSIAFRVMSLVPDGNGGFDTLVDGNVGMEDVDSFAFRDVTTDSYVRTGLVGTAFYADSAVRDGGKTRLVLTPAPGAEVVFAGIVGEGKLDLCVNTAKEFLAVDNPADPGAGGIYRLGRTAREPFHKICNIEVSGGGTETTACREGNGYSDTEVSGFVEKSVGGVYDYGVHPAGELGNLSGAGGLVNWFVSCGKVDAAGGAGRNSVMVRGFGLGAGYLGTCIPYDRHVDTPDSDDGKLHRQLTFGYGTKYNARDSLTGLTALPMDWPFTGRTAYCSSSRENNITLSRRGSAFADGQDTVTVGALELDSHEECEHCGGSGVVPDSGNPGSMVVCPGCRGTGFCDTPTTLLMDRVHVCLYNDFTPSSGDDVHADGSTVLKKTFIHLATPIDTDDGETFEITVSVPNVNIDKAWGAGTDDLKNLSGYYAYVSQPRVYVLGGTWNFSRSRVGFSLSQDRQTVTLDSPFLDSEGDPVVSTPGRQVTIRTTLGFPDYGKKVRMKGTVSNDGLTVSLDSAVTGIPASVTSGYACGAAYVSGNNATLPSDTALGLNNVRLADGALGKDYGEDPEGLEVYNRFYTADADSETRHAIVDGKDTRQVLAAVYPTVTNTFPWKLTGRRKMKFLDRLMTSEADRGTESLFAAVADMNRAILARAEFSSLYSQADIAQIPGEVYPLDLVTGRAALRSSYGTMKDRISVIGTLLKLSDTQDRTAAARQPVRQAIRAAKALSGDFVMSRVRAGALDVASLKLKKDGSSAVGSGWDYGELVALDNNANGYEKEAYSVRLRHLPEYLASAGSTVQREPVSELLNAYPFDDSVYSYYSGNPYGYGSLETTGSIGDSGCDCVGYRDSDGNTDGRVYSLSSAVVAATKMGWFDTPTRYEDLLRSAELAAIDLSEMEGVLPADFYLPQGLRMDSPCLEPIDAFTKLASPDNIPVPEISSWYGGTVDEQTLPFISGDAFGHYAVSHGWTGLPAVIATSMPYEDGEAAFLKDYVSGYGAVMPVRNWDGSRVRVGTLDDSSTVAMTRKHWYDTDCTDAERGVYVADAFLIDEGGNTSTDVNLNRLEFSGISEAMSLDCSVPPYSRNFREQFPFDSDTEKGVDSYIRVFMKFTFSADAGRWYCTDYRQAPVSYLTPLYGAKALEETIGGQRIWVSSACGAPSWRDVAGRPYSEYRPLDINPALVDEVMGANPRRIAIPDAPVDEGGLGLNAPSNKDGTHDATADGMPTANFWNVRTHLRPATGASPLCDIPAYAGEHTYADRGGIMADPVLWGQYDYPAKGEVAYHLPDTLRPDEDMAMRRFVYAEPNGTVPGIMDTGELQSGASPNRILSPAAGR